MIVERAIAAHDPHEVVAGARAIRARGRAGGLLFQQKRRVSSIELAVEADLHTPRLTVRDWPRPDLVGIFEAERVRIETAGGDILRERRDPRAHMPIRRWDDLSFLYFTGYGLWNYTVMPWLLTWPGVEVREVGEGRIDVTFPPSIPTHSREQSFWFGEDGLLQRLDYTAEVVFPFGLAKGTHRVLEYREMGGLVIPSRRRVTPRGLPGPTLVSLEIDDAEVVRA